MSWAPALWKPAFADPARHSRRCRSGCRAAYSELLRLQSFRKRQRRLFFSDAFRPHRLSGKFHPLLHEHVVLPAACDGSRRGYGTAHGFFAAAGALQGILSVPVRRLGLRLQPHPRPHKQGGNRFGYRYHPFKVCVQKRKTTAGMQLPKKEPAAGLSLRRFRLRVYLCPALF